MSESEVTLKEYIESRLRELERTIDLKYQTTEKATLLATYSLEKRLETIIGYALFPGFIEMVFDI